MNQITGTLVPASRWWQKSRLRLTESLEICGYRVAAGFLTDGASIPFPLSLLISPWGRYAPAAVLHDWLLEQRDPFAARFFLKALKRLGITPWLAGLMYGFVVAWSWLKSLIERLKR